MGKRRGHGEGSIYEWPQRSGKWHAMIDLGYVNGKRKRKMLSGKTRKEVAEKLKAAQAARQRGENLAPMRQTMQQFLEGWLEEVVKPNVKAKTYESYSQMVRLYIVPHIGGRQLANLAPGHVQNMLNALRASGRGDGSGLSPRTVQYVRAVLRQALELAVEWGEIPRNVAILVKVPRVEKFTIQPLDEAQARALLDAVRGHRLEALYRVALSLGLRRGEVLGLRWQDIDFTARTLTIVMAVQRLRGRLVLTTPKTESSAQTLPLPEVLLHALKRHQTRQNEEQALQGSTWNTDHLVFPSVAGTLIEPRNLIRHFKAALKSAGLPGTTRFHDLRHSCATLLIVQGVDLKTVSEILRHSSIRVTGDIYVHPSLEAKRQAAAKLDALLPDQASERDA